MWMAEKALSENPGKKVYSLGPLIHNENALSALEEKGLHILEESDIAELEEGSVVIIRAHGVAPSVTDVLEKRGCKIIDATCPRVKASQKMVERYSSENDYVVLTGDKNHGEVIGIAGYAGENFSQIQDCEEAERFNIKDGDNKNVILLSQTTYSPKEFEKIENLFKAKFHNLAVMNTICPATNERQQALLELCSQVEAGKEVRENRKPLVDGSRSSFRRDASGNARRWLQVSCRCASRTSENTWQEA